MAEFDRYSEDYAKLLHDPIRERFAPGSDFFFRRKWELLREYMAGIRMRPETAAWLDVGCGKGDLLHLGAGSFAEAVGCDVSSEMLRDCAGLRVVPQQEATRLPFPRESFDLVTAVCVYHHVPPPDRPLLTSEIARVLRPRGAACIIEHNPFNPVTQIIIHRTPVDADARLLAARAARRLLGNAGLENLRTTYFLYFPENLYGKMRRLEALLARVPAGGQYAVFARKP